jgi:DNA (cytosine-5)-methyltransferase 1
VPQLRERVFVIGHRDGRPFQFPTGTYGNAAQPYLTAWDAIGDIADDDDPCLRVTGRWADLLPSIPEGANYLWHTARGGGLPLFGWRTRYWSFLLKLAKNRPSWTLQAQPGPAIGPFHWSSRRLSTREMCRLQTMPDDYIVPGNMRAVQRLLGNAVPSALAELLGIQIRRQLLRERGVRETPALLPRRSPNCPPAETLGVVPRKYWHLRGTHSAHPGTGLGPAARRRLGSATDERRQSIPSRIRSPR